MDSSAKRDPFAVAALVGAGAIVGHELGYLADTNPATGHDYLSLIAPLALVGVAIAVWASAVSVVRRGVGRLPGVAALAGAQSLLYMGFEVGERTVGSAESPLFSLPVVLGLAAQPLVAWLAIAALGVATAIVASVVASSARPGNVRVDSWLGTDFAWRDPVVVCEGEARAPPLMT